MVVINVLQIKEGSVDEENEDEEVLMREKTEIGSVC